MAYVLLALTILWLVFMTYLSHQDGNHTKKISRDLAEKLSFFAKNDIMRLNSQLRHLAHIFLYAVLTMLFGTMLMFGTGQFLYLSLIVFWAWVDEATKIWIQGRHFSWGDVGLNILGFGVGLAALLALQLF